MNSTKIKCTPVRKLFSLHVEDETEFSIVMYQAMGGVDQAQLHLDEDM